MKYLAVVCTLAFGLVLGGCSTNSPSGESYPTPPAHHNGGGKLGGKLGN